LKLKALHVSEAEGGSVDSGGGGGGLKMPGHHLNPLNYRGSGALDFLGHVTHGGGGAAVVSALVAKALVPQTEQVFHYK